MEMWITLIVAYRSFQYSILGFTLPCYLPQWELGDLWSPALRSMHKPYPSVAPAVLITAVINSFWRPFIGPASCELHWSRV